MTHQHSLPGVDPFTDRVVATIKEHNMAKPGDRILVGVSGGADSVALLHALLGIAQDWRLDLGVAHLNHCLRGQESDRDAHFVETLTKKFGLPLYLKTMDVKALHLTNGLSMEESARIARRDFFSQTSAKHAYSRIALGHHADDNAEWMLLSLIRGAGAGGFSGIPPVNGPLIRPLFRQTRKDILDYCQRHGLEWVQDSTNSDPAILRNRIRHHLMPLLEADYNPSMSQALNRLSDILRTEHDWMDAMAAEGLKKCTRPSESSFEINLKAFHKQPLALQRRILRLAIQEIKGNTRKITLTHIQDILKLCDPASSGTQLHLPEGLQVVRDRDTLGFVLHQDTHWARSKSPLPPALEIAIDGPGVYPYLDMGLTLECTEKSPAENFEFSKGSMEACFDLEHLAFPLVLRPWRPGDRFTPLGMEGSQKVAKFLMDRKVPKTERQNIIVLCSGEKVLWILGYRQAEQAKIRPATRRTLVCKVFLA